MLNKEIYWNLKKLQQKSFEGANKLGKYLAWQLKKRRENRVITKIKEGDKEIINSKGIQREFFKYYAKLFQKKQVDTQKN